MGKGLAMSWNGRRGRCAVGLLGLAAALALAAAPAAGFDGRLPDAGLTATNFGGFGPDGTLETVYGPTDLRRLAFDQSGRRLVAVTKHEGTYCLDRFQMTPAGLPAKPVGFEAQGGEAICGVATELN